MTDALPFRLRVVEPAVAVRRNAVDTTESRLHGLARLDGSTLRLEWSGTVESTVVRGPEVRIERRELPVSGLEVPVQELARVELRGRWFRPRLVLRPVRLDGLAAVPSATGGTLTLWIERRDWALAGELAASLEVEMADAALRAASAPPALPD